MKPDDTETQAILDQAQGLRDLEIRAAALDDVKAYRKRWDADPI